MVDAVSVVVRADRKGLSVDANALFVTRHLLMICAAVVLSSGPLALRAPTPFKGSAEGAGVNRGVSTVRSAWRMSLQKTSIAMAHLSDLAVAVLYSSYASCPGAMDRMSS